MLENELDEKQRMGEMCHRLKDEVRGVYEVITYCYFQLLLWLETSYSQQLGVPFRGGVVVQSKNSIPKFGSHPTYAITLHLPVTRMAGSNFRCYVILSNGLIPHRSSCRTQPAESQATKQ